MLFAASHEEKLAPLLPLMLTVADSLLVALKVPPTVAGQDEQVGGI